MFKALLKDFAQPGTQFRGAPFWAWNGKLDPQELRRQIRIMHRMGLGGFFMHARVGLNTAYLSDEWFDCIKACADEAEKLGMKAWMYDEDRWPSGAAGGLVTKNPAYRARSLMMRMLTKPARIKWDKNTVAAFTAKIDGSAATNVRAIPKGKQPGPLAAGECHLVFEVKLEGLSDWYNGYTYLDVLNPKAVQQFIRVTHEAYAKRVKKYFGTTIPGIFSDEPNHGHKLAHDNNTGLPQGLPWTGALPATFKQLYGYDLLPHLVELVYDVDGQEMTPARHDYHDCVTHLFVDSFARQIGAWCEKHKIAFTGHVLEEDTLSQQTAVVGAPMRFYEFMQAPGMDLLTEHWRVYTTAKQVSSAARQFGRKWRLTETYGCTGWDFPFLGHKALGDWQVALGINLRCQHLYWYTMLGEAKRDYPAAISHQSPWWELYPKVEDYFARVLSMMTRGAEVRDLLVIHPVESAWTMVKAGWHSDPKVQEFDRVLIDLESTLLAAHVDFDYGDEELLSRHAKVFRKHEVPGLTVGKAAYKGVVVPPMKTMRSSTLELLKKFRAAGGLVVFAGDVATHVDAKPSQAVQEFAGYLPRAGHKGDALPKAVAQCRRVSIAGAQGNEIAEALYLLREDARAFYLFVCNTGDDPTAQVGGLFGQPRAVERTKAFADVRIRGFADCAGQPVEFDACAGEAFAADATRSDSGWEIRTSLPALGSRIFVIPKKTTQTLLAPRPQCTDVRTVELNSGPWEIVLSECNNLPLDHPRYRIGKGEWKDANEILRIDRDVRAALGIKARGGAMVQPWARPRIKNPKHVPVELSYSFAVQALPTGDLFLALENPKRFAIEVNGTSVSTDTESGWWTDVSLRRIPINPALIKFGQNEITLSLDYDEEFSGLEIAYLLGTFGTEAGGWQQTIVAAPTTLRLGDWTEQGLAFYSGSVAYKQTVQPGRQAGEHIVVKLPDYRGVAARVIVNGRSAGVIGWEPNEVDITGCVVEGENDLRIEIIGHRRNSHGPLHHAQKWPTWTGPGEFVAGEENWHDGYQLVPCGLMKPPVLTTRT